MTTTSPAFRAAGGGAAGVTFLLIHGVGLSHLSFSRLARALAPHGDVVAPDLPGFGAAPATPRRLTIEEYADALEPVVDRAPGRIVVVGHSLGTELAVELALRRPGRVAGVVLIGSVVDPAAPTAVGQGLRLLRDYVGEPPRTLLMVARCYLQGGPREFLRGTLSMLEYSTDRRIADLGAPLLVLRGARDPIAPEPWSRWLSEQVPGGRYRAVPGARHNCVHSRPAGVAREIAAFVDELVLSRAAHA
ncbi:alpha/beta fold hydrolase [Frondihabitans peucedani]|uniref:Alpha/beta fold hydrolase n=1 Tax=Frondihabitans peucedani TaxID=598626 RepID=A0ABP8E165_9MICO